MSDQISEKTREEVVHLKEAFLALKAAFNAADAHGKSSLSNADSQLQLETACGTLEKLIQSASSCVEVVCHAATASPLAQAAMNDKESKKQAALQFAGQDSDDAKAAVKMQRELKKKRDVLRKLEKKLKAMKPEDAGYAATKAEEKQLLEEVATLVGISGATVAAAATPETGKPKPAAKPTAVVSASTKPAQPPTEVEDLEANAKQLRQLVESTMKNSRSLHTVVTPRTSVVHPSVAEVALMTEEMLVVGNNARTFAMVSAFREMIKSTTVLSGDSLADIDPSAFEKLIAENFAFLRRKREASSGMTYVKEALVRRLVALRDDFMHRGDASHFVDDLGDPRDIAGHLLDLIESELCMSLKSIVEDRSLPYVSSTDTILVFGRSSVVEFILLSRAADPQRKPKKVIVLDSAPLFEGRRLAQKLSAVGINVTYGLLTACCTLIPKCTRVFIGAASVLQNGDVFGRGGTALVAACAKSFRKPVLCFAESYKFVSEVWLGNLAQNTKLGDIRDYPYDCSSTRSPPAYSTPKAVSPRPQEGATIFSTPQPFAICKGRPSTTDATVKAYATTSNSRASGYLYDLTPAAYVDMVICEMGCLHTSAIIAAIKDREGRDASPLMYIVAKS